MDLLVKIIDKPPALPPYDYLSRSPITCTLALCVILHAAIAHARGSPPLNRKFLQWGVLPAGEYVSRAFSCLYYVGKSHFRQNLSHFWCKNDVDLARQIWISRGLTIRIANRQTRYYMTALTTISPVYYRIHGRCSERYVGKKKTLLSKTCPCQGYTVYLSRIVSNNQTSTL